MFARNYLRVIIAALILAFAFAGCDDGDDKGTGGTSGVPEAKSNAQRIQPNLSEQEMAEFTSHNNEFASEFFHQILQEGDNMTKNVVVSPYSVSVDLAMVWAGAEGDTETEMADTLHFEGDEAKVHEGFDALELRYSESNENFTITSANSVWAQDGWNFLQSFLDTLAKYYGAGIRLVDFSADSDAARQTINRWVEDKTHGYIKDLFPPNSISEQTVMVLVNALYFEAKWETTFDGSDTYEDVFETPNGGVTVFFMHATREMDYFDGDGFKAVRLPYKGGEYSMILMLPDDGAEEALLADVAGAVADAVEGFDATEVALALPRFEYSFGQLLNDTLQALGMVKAFTGDADFSGIDGARDLLISKVIHKAFIKVYEEGTVAAAATGTAIDYGYAGPTAMYFNKPFVYVIRDEVTGQIVFMGRVVDPSTN